MSQYYKRRWEFFFETLKNCIKNSRPYKQADFNEAVFREIEYNFDLGQETYSPYPIGDPIEISERLYGKYNDTDFSLIHCRS
ncbi:alpha-N-acetylglucosaminidase [Caerostris extrusa]|uniref:Alpha-N-acetylglucosaminidase n=1 Tax=Caerostris extrusa TaxID=172846 RepID=A0AAV4YBP4_CAEEX|nr:alpha-N-acetylglucosaminidase [Caerostris extrusa]